MRLFVPLALCALLLAAIPAEIAPRWGEHGHEMIGLVAAENLPDEMPEFFRAAAAQLSFLNPEPDRWRNSRERAIDPAMNAAHSPEHWVNFEHMPDGARMAPDRFAYLDTLAAHGTELPGSGLLPFRILEMTQRLRVGFRDWRLADDPRERAWIQQRIINDAGVLGHYVADASNPHHTTIHHNGWVGDNPRGFTTERGFHRRFETVYVNANISLEDVRLAFHNDVRAFPDIREATWTYLLDSHALVERLYELDLEEPFGPDTSGEAHRAFASDRLAAGAEMLRDLWWTAWVTSDG